MEKAGKLVSRNLDEIRSYYDEGESSGNAAALAGNAASQSGVFF